MLFEWKWSSEQNRKSEKNIGEMEILDGNMRFMGIWEEYENNAFISAGAWVATKHWWINGMLRRADDQGRTHSDKRTKETASCDSNERRATTCWRGWGRCLPRPQAYSIVASSDQTWSDSPFTFKREAILKHEVQ